MSDEPNKGGRPTVMTPDTINRLREAFLFGATDEEACAWAEIGMSTLYDYQKENTEFSEKKEEWKKNPILKAKKTLVHGVERDAELALKYLERKLKGEFSLRNEITGKDGEKLVSLAEFMTALSKEK